MTRNRSVDSEWIVGLYDDAGGSGDPCKYSAIKEQIKPDVIAWLVGLNRDLDAEAEMIIDAVVRPRRRERRQSLKDQIEYILDPAIREDAAFVDPLLEWMVPLGTADGLDRKLRYWEPNDFRELVVTAYRGAAERTASAVELDTAVQRLLAEMQVHGAHTFGDFAS